MAKCWNWYISVNVWARASIKSSKYRKCLWLSCWYIQLPVSLSVKKVSHERKMAVISKILKYQTQLQFDLRYTNYAKTVYFMMVASTMTSHGGPKAGPLYPFINEITAVFMIAKMNKDIIIKLPVHSYRDIITTSCINDVIDDVTRSQNILTLKMMSLHQYFS